MAQTADVIIVGGGIAGASLAYALAHAGRGVTVLEATTAFEDRVRGETMQPWGVKEARELGVEQVMLEAGAHVAGAAKLYAEGAGEVAEVPISMLVPGVPGTLNLCHPVACDALTAAAEAAGASVVRGAADVTLIPGSAPTVGYTVAGSTSELRAQLIVGADGRASTVRKQAAIPLERQKPISYITGLLLADLDDVPDDHDVLAGEGDVFFAMFHQGSGRARVYLITGASRRGRFAGHRGVQSFLDACGLSCYPWSSGVTRGRPIGPVATYPGDDTWTANPYADGVVLIGDAAGHNDPIIAQGLSIAMRDARLVRDLILAGAHDQEPFESYAAERLMRMERLRFIADVVAAAQAEDADNRSARRALLLERIAAGDPEVMTIPLGMFAGPETVPAEAMDPTLLQRIRNAS